MASHAEDLARLLPDLGARIGGVRAALVDDPDAERRRLFDAVTHWLGAIARRRPMLLVLDDLQWAERSSLLLLRHVLDAPPDAPVLVVVTLRDGDVEGMGPLHTLGLFEAGEDVERLELSGLPPSAIERLKTYSWPGNVRELENLMRRMAVLYSESVIDRRIVNTALAEQEPSPAARANGGGDETLSQSVERHLDGYFKAHPHGLPASGLYDRILREVERPLLALSLQATRGNQIRAAELLGLNRNTLRKKLRELDLQPSRSTK